MLRRAGLITLLSFAAACAAESSPSPAPDDNNEVKVDTSTPAARRQYDANVALATSYAPQCTKATTQLDRPRVLVTGFGRFMAIASNATGHIVSTLVPAVRYPDTQAPAPGEVDPPEPQLSVGLTTLEVPGVGAVDVCAMILPVYWDLAAILIAKETEAFRPSFVMMNGVAGPRQPLWIELGAANRASKNVDGSNQVKPALREGEDFVKIIEDAPESEDRQSNLLAWDEVVAGARAAVQRHAAEIDAGTTFEDILPDVKLAGFPRPSNTYLCNNVTYATGWLMSHPDREVRLLRASHPLPHKPNDVVVKLTADLRDVPRVFVHWPSELADKHHEAAADVMKALITAQLTASAPTPGDNALADPTLLGGEFF